MIVFGILIFNQIRLIFILLCIDGLKTTFIYSILTVKCWNVKKKSVVYFFIHMVFLLGDLSHASYLLVFSGLPHLYILVTSVSNILLVSHIIWNTAWCSRNFNCPFATFFRLRVSLLCFVSVHHFYPVFSRFIFHSYHIIQLHYI